MLQLSVSPLGVAQSPQTNQDKRTGVLEDAWLPPSCMSVREQTGFLSPLQIRTLTLLDRQDAG